MKHRRLYLTYILVLILVLITILIWFFVFKNKPQKDYLKVAFLDVGQGDAIYIEAPNGKQMLIDGGPNARVLLSLSKVMPFADRSIDVVLATHGDYDHIGGLPLILDNYKVSKFIDNGISSQSQTSSFLEEKIINKKNR